MAEDIAGELDEELFEPVAVLVFRLSCLAFFIMSFSLLSALIIWIFGVILAPLPIKINSSMINFIHISITNVRLYLLELDFLCSLDLLSITVFGELLSFET